MDTEKRLRSLTPKGMAQFEERVALLEAELDKAWTLVLPLLEKEEPPSEDLSSSFKAYLSKYEEVRQFLVDTRTTEANVKLNEIDKVHIDRLQQHDLKAPPPPRPKTRSGRSKVSKSSISESIVLAQAKAAAAKVKVQMSEKQLKVKEEIAALDEKQQVAARESEKLKEKLTLLEEQKELAVAEAELQVLQEGEADEFKPSLMDEGAVKMRTAQFVLDNTPGPQIGNTDSLPTNHIISANHENPAVPQHFSGPHISDTDKRSMQLISQSFC